MELRKEWIFFGVGQPGFIRNTNNARYCVRKEMLAMWMKIMEADEVDVKRKWWFVNTPGCLAMW